MGQVSSDDTLSLIRADRASSDQAAVHPSTVSSFESGLAPAALVSSIFGTVQSHGAIGPPSGRYKGRTSQIEPFLAPPDVRGEHMTTEGQLRMNRSTTRCSADILRATMLFHTI